MHFLALLILIAAVAALQADRVAVTLATAALAYITWEVLAVPDWIGRGAADIWELCAVMVAWVAGFTLGWANRIMKS